MNKGKLVRDYVLFVGVPLLALVGILHAGKHLAAPVALHGDWNVQADFGPWQGVPCGVQLLKSSPLLLRIDQSGGDLTVTLNDLAGTALPATVNGFSLATTLPTGEGTAPAPLSSSGCLGSQSLRIQATVNQHEKQRTLKGTFSLDGCASCPPIAFSATRPMPTGRAQQ
jgi:hypothetical protein